jgi:hypothetical protein
MRMDIDQAGGQKASQTLLVKLLVDRPDLEKRPPWFFCTGHFRERPSLSVGAAQWRHAIRFHRVRLSTMNQFNYIFERYRQQLRKNKSFLPNLLRKVQPIGLDAG